MRGPLVIAICLLPTLATFLAGQSFPDDAVAHWHLNELGGTVAEERIAGLDGSVQGALPVDALYGNARQFDGVDDRVLLPQAAIDALGGLDQGSLSVWFRFEAFGPQQFVQPILHLGVDATDEPLDVLIVEVGHRLGPDNRRLYITWIVDDALPLCFDSGFDLEFDTWYHFVATVGPQGNTGYLDGVELVDRHYNFGGPDDQVFFADIPDQDLFALGYGRTADFHTQDFEHFHGRIDELRVYDRPLAAAEVLALHQAEASAILAADDHHLVAADGGTVHLLMDAGPGHAGELRLLLAGLSGSAPGTPLPGPWQTVLPLNWDAFTDLLLAHLGSAPFEGFAGSLDGQGRGLASLHLPPLPPGTQATFSFAYAVKPWTLASNPVEVQLGD